MKTVPFNSGYLAQFENVAAFGMSAAEAEYRLFDALGVDISTLHFLEI